MDESSAHWEYYFVMGGLASVRAARIRIVTRRRNTKGRVGQHAFGVLLCDGMRGDVRAAHMRGVLLIRDT